MKIQVFDPPMCCATGVCGPSVDPVLVRFAADLDWLRRRGADVSRYNLSQQPFAFAGNAVVKAALEKDGNDCLPLILVDGAVVCQGSYPTREALAGFAGFEVEPSLFTDAVKELVAIGAAIASNCEVCFKHHFNEARKLGVSKEDVRLAVEMALAVKDAPARSIAELAGKHVGAPAAEPVSCCCSPSSSGEASQDGTTTGGPPCC